MNKKGYLAFSALTFAMLLASCGPKNPSTSSGGSSTPNDSITEVEIPADFSDKDLPATKDVFNTTYGTDPTSFAAFATNEQPNSMHICNFVDGLVENDNYGVLKPALAESIPTAVIDEKTGEASYTFKLKEGLTWSKWNEAGTELVSAGPVKASDFVTAAKLALDPSKEGGASYLYFMFVKNSQQYYEMQVPNSEGVVEATPEEIQKFFDENVGIKADDAARTITYTLPYQMDYFPTVLTYACYYPVPTELYNSITDKYGAIDGEKTKHNIWYNGAFALSSLQNNNHIDYVKNPTYWDAANVSLNKIHMIVAPQDADMSWGRQQFEANTIDGFRLTELDDAGWKKYVTGTDGSGSLGNPVDNYANARYATPESTTFYLGYNFNRKLFKNTELSQEKIDDFETAIANVNFRKAILYAVDKGVYNSRRTPSNPNQWTTNTYTIPTLAVDDNGRDYTDYIVDEFAAQNAMTFEEAKNIIGSGKPGVNNPEAAQQYLKIAQAELGDSVSYPIEFEIVEQQNESQSAYYKAFADSLQQNLDPSGDIVHVTVKQLSTQAMNDAFYYQDYSVAAYFGWAPDYGDPLSFLNTVTKGGDLTPNFGFSGDEALEDKVLGTYTNLVEYANSLHGSEARLKAYAKAEYYLLFEQALLIPMTQRYQGIEVQVTKVKPYTGQLAPYGMGSDKLKGAVVYEEKLNKVQYAYIVKKYNEGKESK